jgi:hypothetical protein
MKHGAFVIVHYVVVVARPPNPVGVAPCGHPPPSLRLPRELFSGLIFVKCCKEKMTDDEERDERGVNLSGQELIAHGFVNVSDQKNPGHLADIARFEIEWNLLTTFGQERDCCWCGGIRLHISEVLIHLILNNFWTLGRAPLGRTPSGRIDALVHELVVFKLSLAMLWDFAICCSEIKLLHDSLR